jgi:hypothetical protein
MLSVIGCIVVIYHAFMIGGLLIGAFTYDLLKHRIKAAAYLLLDLSSLWFILKALEVL